MKILYFIIFGCINITVLTLWPTGTVGNKAFERANKIWDPIQNVIVLVMDMAVNVFFVYSVKRKLLSFGLTKYKKLITANILVIVANVTIDVCIMSSPLIYPYICLRD
jgi:hypothetical protein